MLFINQQEYIGVLSQSAGIRFLVHRRDHFPFLEEEGQNAGPGTLTAVKLMLVNVKVCLSYWNTLNAIVYLNFYVQSKNTFYSRIGKLVSQQSCPFMRAFVQNFLLVH